MARSKIKTLGLTDIHVDNVSGERAALGWNYQGARFHIWVTLPDLTPGGSIVTASKPATIFKNPIAERGEPGHFDTRRIDGTAKLGALMIAEATAYALAYNLVAGALIAKAAEDKAEADKNAAAIAERRKEKAAGAMYDVIVALRGDPMTRLSEMAIAMTTHVLKLADEGGQP